MKLLAPIPDGDGPGRSHKIMRTRLSRIARRVGARALMEGREDLLLEVYCAGLFHASELEEREA